MMSLLYFFDRFILWTYIYIVFASVVLGWLIAFNVVNPYNQFVRSIWDLFHRLTEPALRPIRRRLPDLGGIDISPMILIIVLLFISWLINDTLPRYLP